SHLHGHLRNTDVLKVALELIDYGGNNVHRGDSGDGTDDARYCSVNTQPRRRQQKHKDYPDSTGPRTCCLIIVIISETLNLDIMMLALTLLVGVVGMTIAEPAVNNNWWDSRNNNWNGVIDKKIFGRIDFRYPDWVVSPRPPCTQEGVFPHPGSPDCTWYYRCVARVGIPRYATFYFQCEPGTMFEDDLDQCVHPHSGYQCQGSVPPVTQPSNICSVIPSSCADYLTSCPSAGRPGGKVQLCQRESCTLTGVKDICEAGQLLDTATNRCVKTPSLQCTPIFKNCTAVQSTCKTIEVCTGTASYKQNVCEMERCERAGVDLGVSRMCNPTGKYWDMDNKKCIYPASEDTCNSCEITKTNCRDYDLCKPSSVKNLCDCSLCGFNEIYDPQARRCISKSVLCPVLECVFRDNVCRCVNGNSICQGCYMRGNLVRPSTFCKDSPNPQYYHVEGDYCLDSSPGFDTAAVGHCPRLRSRIPALQCSLRDNNFINTLIRCWADKINF
ncbi:unnamed protein product, partial [Meganyctiphanes norvegica]